MTTLSLLLNLPVPLWLLFAGCLLAVFIGFLIGLNYRRNITNEVRYAERKAHTEMVHRAKEFRHDCVRTYRNRRVKV